ncbi:MAG: hypothetical protein IT438_07935 [Phycisphaerales bacterium]|nr:hypothetical protein [Phycisphaerales bacterium]
MTTGLTSGQLASGGAIILDRGTWSPRTLPYLPIWPALLANILFYFTLFAATTAAARALTRFRRRRRGQCPRCAYDLRATPPASPCPECGTAR